MYIALAAFLIIHGLAHMVGFVGPWGLSPATTSPPSTLFIGHVTLGETAMRTLGVFWLGGVFAFLIAAFGVLHHSPWWPAFTFGAAIGSLLLCAIALPVTKLGLAANVAIIVGVLLAHPEVVRT